MNLKVTIFSTLFAAALTSAHAQLLIFEFSGIHQSIPDGDPTGLANAQTITGAPDLTIADLNVSLDISGVGVGGFNGDLYVALQHENGFAVLLNRPGRRSGTPFGYSDSGLSVTFDDSASADIHNYRFELSGSHSASLSDGVSGTWSPDARESDPTVVLDTTERTAYLNDFTGLPINGTWALFAADLSAGGVHQLDGWSMEITAVPEPTSLGIAATVGLLAYSVCRRIRTRRRERCSPTRVPCQARR